MEAVFLKLLDMSITATWLVLVVLVLRFLLKKSPKWIHCCLWALVAVRLLCPVSFESALSLIPETAPVTARITQERDTSTTSNAVGEYGLHQDAAAATTAKLQSEPADGEESSSQMEPAAVLTAVWLLGMAGMAAYAFISYRKLRKRVAPSIALVENLYLCDYIESPFILGIVSPKIYLPSDMDPNAAAHVLAHERAHIRRKDHWWKPLGFILLTLHWFNPVMWLAYVLLCRDIELACDEKVIREMGPVDKKSYSEALLSCSVPRHMIAACPLAFGEVGVKARVKSVLNYKKPTFWIVLVAVIALIVTSACFLTDPVADPFGRTYQVNVVLYRHPAVSFYVVPKDMPIYDLTEDGKLRILEDKDSGNWLTPGSFESVSLTADNFDAHLDLILEDDFSPAALREENRKAWVLYVNDLDAAASSVFYYLLMQDNGDVYFVQGTCGGRVEDGGVRSISAVCKLGEETSNDPFASAETPYQWTRNLGTEFVEWMQVTAYDDDGTQQRFTLGWAEQARLVRILNDLSPNDFELGRLSGQNTLSCYVACNDGSGRDPALDVNLRYDGEAVDMVFGTEEGAQRYETADSKHWVIRNDALNAFFAEYPLVYDQAPAIPETIPDSGRMETVAEYSYGYANMKVSLLEGWEYEIVEHTDDQTPFGIRFRPEGEEGWLSLQFWPDMFGVCGTGLEPQTMQLSSGYTCSVAYYDGSDIWSFLIFMDQPGSYVLSNEGANSWMAANEDEIMTILENIAIAEGVIDVSQAENFALTHAASIGWIEDASEGDPEVDIESRFDYETGIWTVTLRMAGHEPLEVQLVAMGGVLE